jgi:uncharacterized YceG family protein
MVQQRPGVIPPRPGPPPRRTSRRTILLRRALALTVLAALVGFGVWLAYAATREGGGESAAPTQITSIRRVPDFRVIFPEGFTRAEMAKRVQAVAKIAQRKRKVKPKLSSKSYLAATRPRRIPGFGATKRSLEGFLFPATYNFTAKTTSAKLAHDQLKAFRDNWKQVDLRYARLKNLTPYDVLIIASMVEREALAPDERPLIAAVIYNRLRNGMPLGIDATLRYGLGIPGTKSIRQSQLQSSSPYNTRNRTGLPPTPIANPGLASLQAAAHPARVKYLYFVRKPDKVHHFFTSSYRAFQNYANAHGY